MSRKSRKQSRMNREAAASGTSRVTTSRTDDSFNPDYSYVIRDLKRIGTLAASFLAILVVLSFFLR